MSIRAFSLASLAGLASLCATPAGAAGFFDDFARTLFGAPQPRRVVLPSDPLQVTVKPRRRKSQAAHAKGPVAETEATLPKPPAVKLDPSKDPNWFLKDPTMRQGDIVITDRGVLVFRGRAADAMRRADFAALGGKASDGTWKGRLQAAAAGGRSFFADDALPDPNAAAAAIAQPPNGHPTKTVQR